MKSKYLVFLVMLLTLSSCTYKDSNASGTFNDMFEEFYYEYPHNMKYYGIFEEFSSIVNPRELEDWKNQFKLNSNVGYRENEELNVYTFVKEFKIKKNKFENINNSIEGFPLFTKEEIEAIYTDDKNKIDELFRNPYSLYHDNKIYTPKWLCESDIIQYNTEKIKKQDIKIVISIWEEDGLFINQSANLKNRLEQ